MLTNEQIFEAERLRTLGQYADAYSIVISVIEYKPREIKEFSRDNQTRFLMSIRIAFGCAFSMLKRQRNDALFVSWLGVCVGILRTFYANGDIVTIAHRTKVDVVGNPYSFQDEMNRDMWRYKVFFARLTEDYSDFQDAIIASAVITQNMTDNGTRWLTIFEQELFQVERNGYLLEQTVDAYHTCIEIAKGRNQWERVATVSARYMVACTKYGEKMRGLGQLPQYTQAVFNQPNTATILFREIVKSGTEARFIRARKAAIAGIDWSLYRL